MQTSARKLDRRVTVLEPELRKVRSELKSVGKVSQRPWWKRPAGSFKNDSLLDDTAAADEVYRRSLIPRAR